MYLLRSYLAPARKAGVWVLLSVLTAMATATVARGQQRIALPGTELSVEKVMAAIQDQTGCFFAFDGRVFDVTRTVRSPQAEAGVEELLKLITDGTGFAWLRNGVYIVIHYAPRPEPSEPSVAYQPRTSDTYSPSDPLADAFRPREVLSTPPVQPASESPAIPAIPRVLPAPYSAYRAPDIFTPMRRNLPRLALKTDLVYTAATLTPNIGAEWGFSHRSTVEFTWGWNQWNHEGTKKLNHGLARIEYRRWFCERYNGHFVGVNVFGSKYNVGGYDIPLLFEREYRYEGWAYGAGLTYGYHLALARRWGLEFQVGLGVARYDHTRFECVRCGTMADRPSGVWFGPTRAGVDLVFLLWK